MMDKPEPVKWTELDDALLTKLWADGLSVVRIGERMRRSKNSVVGRAHRLGLPARPSPIKRVDPQAPSSTRGSLTQRANSPRRQAPRVTLTHVDVVGRLGVVPVPLVKPPPALPLRSVLPARCSGPRCCWPLNDGRPLWLFCTSMAVGEKPYCAAHCKVAYVVLGEKRGDGI